MVLPRAENPIQPHWDFSTNEVILTGRETKSGLFITGQPPHRAKCFLNILQVCSQQSNIVYLRKAEKSKEKKISQGMRRCTQNLNTKLLKEMRHLDSREF